MDPVSLAIAFGPLSLYLLALGVINLRRRATLISGDQNVIGLALALVGLIIVGPMNLFVPQAAAMRFGPYAWLLLLAFYGLCVTLYALVARQRLIVFNFPRERSDEVLSQVTARLDRDSQVAGTHVHLPNVGVQFHVERTSAMRSVVLAATGDRQSPSGWQRLRAELGGALRTVEVAPNPRGFTLLAIAAALMAWPIVQLLQMPGRAVAQRLIDMLRL